jgi:hypothetical protein
MVRRFSLLFVVTGIALAMLPWLTVAPSRAADEKDPPQSSEKEIEVKPGLRKTAIKAFMRKKLAASQSLIEGLALEDFELIEKGTAQLKAMSIAAEFMVVDDPLYAGHADEFRRTVAKTAKAAKEKRLDGATLGFVDMTMSCVECHKFVRAILVAQ